MVGHYTIVTTKNNKILSVFGHIWFLSFERYKSNCIKLIHWMCTLPKFHNIFLLKMPTLSFLEELKIFFWKRSLFLVILVTVISLISSTVYFVNKDFNFEKRLFFDYLWFFAQIFITFLYYWISLNFQTFFLLEPVQKKRTFIFAHHSRTFSIA